jgi:hypothetical protein
MKSIKIFLLSLIVIFIFSYSISVFADQPSEMSAKKIQTENSKLFEYNYTNYAWVYTNKGWYIKTNGAIIKYSIERDGTTTTEKVGSVSLKILKNYTKLLTKSSKGILSDKDSNAADMGIMTYSGYLNNKQIILYKYGDFIQTNSAPESKVIVNWLNSLNETIQN